MSETAQARATHELPQQRELPSGWRWVRLGEFMPKNVGSLNPALHLDEVFVLYSIPAFDRGEPDIVFGKAVGSTKQIVLPGDILLSKIVPHIRRTCVVGSDTGRRMIASTEWIVFRTTGADSEYLKYALTDDDFHREFMDTTSGVGGSLLRARPALVAQIEIPLPPLAEQLRIARVLKEQMAAVEKARAAAQSRFAAVKALPAAFLHQVFPQPGQPLPDGWRWVRLDDVCEVRLGKMLSPASKLGNRSIPYIRNANVQWNRFDLTDVAEMDFSEDQESILTLKIGDLLVCEGGEPGRAAVWQGQISRCCYQKALHRLRPINDAIDPYFIMYRLWHGASSSEFTDSNAKTTIAHLPAIRLKSLKLAIPPLSEQRRIVAIIEEQIATAEKARIAAEEELAAIEALSGALLRRAFNGKL